jgi:adenylosuccinate synthase
MQDGKFNVIIDAFWGSSGKGKTSTWLADHFAVTRVSSSNFPNAGHTAAFEDGTKFVAKAIPTAAILKKTRGMGIECFLSPGSGFAWKQLIKEWVEAGKPTIRIHDRASIVTEDHAKREREGSESTMHIASTMQGSGTAIADKVLRKADCQLAGTQEFQKVVEFLFNTEPAIADLLGRSSSLLQELVDSVRVVDAHQFRSLSQGAVLDEQHTWLHEGSQGFALSIDHGSHYPHCTSRNCTVQAALDHMAMPAQVLGDVYLNLRTFPIRVGNVIGEDGKQKGYSGDFYPDCKEMTWEQVAAESGMPADEAKILAERERTTVTKRIRRVSDFTYFGLQDAVRTNGATKLVMNFIQYINWEDRGLKGGKEAFDKLSKKSRDFIVKVEESVNRPVVLVGTGALHDEMISLL